MAREYTGDKSFDSLEEAKKFMDDSVKSLSGRSGILCCLYKGKYNVFKFKHQPCWGFLRKYGEDNNVTKCTQPDDEKPGDLYNEWLSGTPQYLITKGRYSDAGIRFIKDSKQVESIVDFLINSDRSLFRNGIKGVKFEVDDGKNVICYFHDMDIDPTIMVNFLTATTSRLDGVQFYLDIGLDMEKAVFAGLFFGGCVPGWNGAKIFSANNYYFDTRVDVKRVKEGNFQKHLSGGTLKNKFDYNRESLHQSFCNFDRHIPVPAGDINFFNVLLKKVGKNYSNENIKKAVENIYDNA